MTASLVQAMVKEKVSEAVMSSRYWVYTRYTPFSSVSVNLGGISSDGGWPDVLKQTWRQGRTVGRTDGAARQASEIRVSSVHFPPLWRVINSLCMGKVCGV